MLQGVSTAFLLLSSLLAVLSLSSENTSADRVELIPAVNRFSPDSSILHTGRQVFRDITESKGIVKVADNFYEEYLYDDDAVVSPKTQESMERSTVRSTEVTTIESTVETTTVEESTESSPITESEPATIIPTVAPVFATLLVSPIPFHEIHAPEVTTTVPAPRSTYLKSGDVYHLKQDVTVDEFDLKQYKKPDWRRIWKSLRPKKRTIVSNTVGIVPDNLPPPPPGATFIEIPQVRARRTTNPDSPKNTNSQEDYPLSIRRDQMIDLPAKARPLRRIDADPLALTAPISTPLTYRSQFSDASYSSYRKKFDQALQALNSVEDDVLDQLDATEFTEKNPEFSRSPLGPILKLVSI